MKSSMLSGMNMPFCPGCSHGPSVKFLSNALEECGYTPLDVILVSDIGCCGLVDPLFSTHTIHGLHGRAPALAMGVAMGLNDRSKKVIAIQGDGGATIGLQHLLEASRRNLDVTLILLNNLIYGMTGGQVSGLSSQEFKSAKNIEDDAPPFDICQLAHVAGAALTTRVSDPKKITSAMVEAINTPGFSIVEISSLCQQYGLKKVAELEENTRTNITLRRHFDRPSIEISPKKTLFSIEEQMVVNHTSSLNKKIGILIAGSAGGGVQSAAKLLAKAAMISGLSSTMKGEYPITVGTGFSLAEVILSQEEIHYTGLEQPDVVIIVSQDGFDKVHPRVASSSLVYLDSSVEVISTTDFKPVIINTTGGKKGAALSAITQWLQKEAILSIEALQEVASNSRYANKLIKIIDESCEVVKD